MGRIWRGLRSAFARFRKPAVPAPPRRPITTAEAWDLWRAACCDERGGHWWQTSENFGRGHEFISFACGCCPATLDVYPAGDEIRLPWGVTIPILIRECKHCGAEFRWVKSTAMVHEYCSRTHAKAARKARTRPERMAAHEAQLQADREAKRARVRLVACAEREKVRYDDERSASLHAATFERKFSQRMYPYECPCGYWHLTKIPPDARERAEALKRALFGDAEARTA